MIYAEILAAGKGTRMGNTEMPKQFLMLGKQPIIIHTIEKFLLVKSIDKVIIVTPKQWIEHTYDIVKKYIPQELISRIIIIEGGKERNESILKGIEYIEGTYGILEEDIIITHDAVRPFVTDRIIKENIKYAIKYGATDTVIPAYDTIVESLDNSIISNIPNRNIMYQGQTPQTFKIKEFKEIYNTLSNEEKEILTDAAKVYVIKNKTVRLIEGEISNMKITTTYDLKVANMLIGE